MKSNFLTFSVGLLLLVLVAASPYADDLNALQGALSLRLNVFLFSVNGRQNGMAPLWWKDLPQSLCLEYKEM